MERVVDISEAPLRYHVRTWPLAIGGVFMAIVTIPFILIAIWRIWMVFAAPDAREFHFVDAVVLCGLVLFGGLAMYGIGLALARPVGLRLDEHGILGFFAPSLPWQEIAGLEKMSFYQGEGVIIHLKDKRSFLAAQSTFGRIRHVLTGNGKRTTINTTQMRVPVDKIIWEMEKRLSESRRNAGHGAIGRPACGEQSDQGSGQPIKS